MRDYSTIENLTEKQIFELYENFIESEEHNIIGGIRQLCYCTCNDRYAVELDCYSGGDNCIPARTYTEESGRRYRCDGVCDNGPGGMKSYYYRTGYCWRV